MRTKRRGGRFMPPNLSGEDPVDRIYFAGITSKTVLDGHLMRSALIV
jgi:hypothetical protein